MEKQFKEIIDYAKVWNEEMKKTVKEIIDYVKEEKRFDISESDVITLLKEGGYKDISYLKEDIVCKDEVEFFTNMSELLAWQNDGGFDALELLKDVLNYSIDENFIKEYNKLKCTSLADYYNAKNKEELGTRVYLSNSVAYIFG